MSTAAPTAVPAERFDITVMRAFAAEPSRHTRDRLISEVDAGRHDAALLRSADGLGDLSEAEERRAAVNMIDFAFEPLVMPGLSLAQAQAYCHAIERTVQMDEASGLDGPNPVWVDTVHHACVFSVLFQFAAHFHEVRTCDQVVLLHQGLRPEPRLDVVATLAARLLGVQPMSLPLKGSWFRTLAGTATPRTLILSLADMPAVATPAPSRRRPGHVELHAGNRVRLRVEVVSGSRVFAQRLGANHLVLDYPQADRLRLAPFDPDRMPACPLVDWIFWPILVGDGPTPQHHHTAGE